MQWRFIVLFPNMFGVEFDAVIRLVSGIPLHKQRPVHLKLATSQDIYTCFFNTQKQNFFKNVYFFIPSLSSYWSTIHI